MPNPRHRLSLSVQHASRDADSPRRPQVERWLRAALEGPATVSVRFVAEEEGRALNRDYRHKDYATNVLSFDYEHGAETVGDLVICIPVVHREAGEQGKSLEAHYAHLIVHGMLHLQGYDHETGVRDARRMEAREREILAGLGYPDPYHGSRQ